VNGKVALFERIHLTTFAFPRKRQENLGFTVTQTPRSQHDRINTKLSKAGSI
jgi:hypothetical protein